MPEEKKEKKSLLEWYKRYFKHIEFRVQPAVWLVASVAISIAVGIGTFALITVFYLPVSPLVAFVALLVVADVMLSYPYILHLRRIHSIEESLPDALKQLADTLKAGGTYEFGLREISTSEYGPLSVEMENVLRKMEEGENLEDSLNSFAENVDSVLVKRTIAIVNDAIKAGAGLAEVLDEIADDVRAMHRIAKERIGGTMLQVMFIIAAGSVVTPVIMGMVSTVVQLFIEIAAGAAGDKMAIVQAIATKNFIVMLMQLYLMIEVVASGVMVSLTREGKMGKSLIYIPVLLLIAFIFYYISVFVTVLMIGGIKA